MLTERNMNTSGSDQIDQLIARFLGGQSTAEEIQQLELWIKESDNNRKYFLQMKNLWDASVQIPVSTDKALNKVIQKIKPEPTRISIWQFMQKVAAILFIPLLITAIWMGLSKSSDNNSSALSYHQVVAAFGTFSKVDLPDGSKVWLNSGSSLRYPEKFNTSNRVVYLIGEGYFEVNANKSVPFLVTTPYFTVKATGTKFNIRAERNFRSPSVTLVEGTVAIQKNVAGQPKDLITYLKPSQHLSYDTLTGHFNIQTEDTYKHFAWKDGKLVFRNDNISEVARRISLQYNVDIEIRGNEIKKYRYRATFESEPLGELLRLLKISSPIDYLEVKPKALPDGTFSRRKIIIFSSTN